MTHIIAKKNKRIKRPLRNAVTLSSENLFLRTGRKPAVILEIAKNLSNIVVAENNVCKQCIDERE